MRKAADGNHSKKTDNEIFSDELFVEYFSDSMVKGPLIDDLTESSKFSSPMNRFSQVLLNFTN